MVREHSYDETTGICVHCGDKKDSTPNTRSCVAREVPRATPQSMFGGAMDDIRARYLEIRAETEKNLARSKDAG